MAQDEHRNSPDDPTEAGTQPLPVGELTGRTAGLPQAVTATVPLEGLPPAPPPGYAPPGYAPPGYAQPGSASPTPPGPGPRQARAASRTGRRAAILLACALVGVAVGVGAQQLLTAGDDTPDGATTASSAPAAPVEAKVSSFSTSGSGFRAGGDTWTSQGYTSAKFGNLKPGIGLLLDLGSARQLKAVTLQAGPGPLTIELRAADDKASGIDGYQRVGEPVQADGATSLPAGDGGEHRYWLVWVTQLAPSGGSFRAELSSVTATS